MSPISLDYEDPTPEERAEARQSAKEAAEAFERGRAVPPTLDGYREAAHDGETAVLEGLAARAGDRWRNVRECYGFGAAIALPRLNRLISIDAGLAELGFVHNVDADPSEALAHGGADWPGQLRGGADSVACAARFLMLYQPIGAAAYLRGQTERWTSNRATTLGIERREGESQADFMNRVWHRGTPLPLPPGAYFAEMSELLHGRGHFVPMAVWESRDLAEWPPPADASLASMVLPEAGMLVLQQVTACVMDLARRAGRDDLVGWLMDFPMTTDPLEQEAVDKVWLGQLPLMPPSLTEPFVSRLGAADQAYHEFLATVRSEPVWPGMTVLALLSRRYRATQGAVFSFQQEQIALGAEFNPRSLYARDTRYIVVGELAALVGRWIAGSPGQALIVASSALRSAFAMWLEDDNRSMIAVRTMLECVAQARTWRLKPDKAARLEARGLLASPRDWLVAAGWRRLGVFNAALGELSHTTPRSRYGGALGVLAAVQAPEAVTVDPINTGRGEALDQTVFLLTIEALEWLKTLDEPLAVLVQKALKLPADPEADVEAWLARSWANRDYDFGGPSFRKVDLEDLERRGFNVDDIVLGRTPIPQDDGTED
jgi:hypothetical protein